MSEYKTYETARRIMYPNYEVPDPSKPSLSTPLDRECNWASTSDRERVFALAVGESPYLQSLVTKVARLLGPTVDAPLWTYWMLRNRAYIESRFKPDAYNKTSGASGVGQVVRSTAAGLAERGYPIQLPAVQSWDSMRNGVDLMIGALSGFVDVARTKGVPAFLQRNNVLSDIPEGGAKMLSVLFYYHNGTSGEPYWDSRTDNEREKIKYRNLLLSEAAKMRAILPGMHNVVGKYNLG